MILPVKSEMAVVMVLKGFEGEQPVDKLLVARLDFDYKDKQIIWHASLARITTFNTDSKTHERKRYKDITFFQDKKGESNKIEEANFDTLYNILKSTNMWSEDSRFSIPTFAKYAVPAHIYFLLKINGCQYHLVNVIADLAVFNYVEVSKMSAEEKAGILEVRLSKTQDPKFEEEKTKTAQLYKDCKIEENNYYLSVTDRRTYHATFKKPDGKYFDYSNIQVGSEELKKIVTDWSRTKYFGAIYSAQKSTVYGYFESDNSSKTSIPLFVDLYVNGLLTVHKDNEFFDFGGMSMKRFIGQLGCEMKSMKTAFGQAKLYDQTIQRLVVRVTCPANRLMI